MEEEEAANTLLVLCGGSGLDGGSGAEKGKGERNARAGTDGGRGRRKGKRKGRSKGEATLLRDGGGRGKSRGRSRRKCVGTKVMLEGGTCSCTEEIACMDGRCQNVSVGMLCDESNCALRAVRGR